MGATYLNSGTHTYMTNTLWSESASQPKNLHLNKMVSLDPWVSKFLSFKYSFQCVGLTHILQELCLSPIALYCR